MSDGMMEEHDPELLALFAQAEHDLPGEDFVAGVSAAIDRARQRRRVRNVSLACLFVLLEWLLDTPLSQGLGQLAVALESTLVPVTTPWLQLLLAPVNSLAGVVGLSLLLLHSIYRRVWN